MEKAMFQQLPQRTLNTHFDQITGIKVAIAQGIQVGELNSRDPLHRQHSSPRILPVNTRHVDILQVAVELSKLLGVATFLAVVHLFEDAQAKLVHDGDKVAAQLLEGALDEASQSSQNVEVEGNALGQIWALYFDSDCFTAPKFSFINLPQRCRCNRFGA